MGCAGFRKPEWLKNVSLGKFGEGLLGCPFHDHTGTNGEITNAHYYDISNRYPAGGFDASAEDLLRFVIAVGSGKVVKPDTVNDMWTAQRTSDGANTVFGLGWGVSK